MKKRSEKTQQISSSQAHKSYSVKVKESRKGDSHSKTHHAKKTQVERRPSSPASVGCFHRPKLPDEILAQAAIRDDLGTLRNTNLKNYFIRTIVFSNFWSQRLQQFVRQQRHGAAELYCQHPRGTK